MNDSIRQKIHEFIDQVPVPGIAVAVVKDGIQMEFVGKRNATDEFNKDTIFKQASLTKAFFAAAVGILVHQEKLEWDTPIVKYLPDFKLKDAWITQNVTVVDILSHRVGLANHEAIWYGDTTNRDSAKDIYRNLEFLEFQSGFRDSFNYSNILYGVVGKLITTVSGMPFQDFLAKNIFEPLGMTNYTWNTVEYVANPNHAATHIIDLASNEFKYKEITPFDENIEFFFPAGALYTTTEEMSKWLRCLVNDGQNEQGAQVLYGLDKILNIHNPKDASFEPLDYGGFGLGWIISQFDKYPVFRHSGGMPGVKTYLQFSPKARIGVYVASNCDDYRFSANLSNWIFANLVETGDSLAMMEKSEKAILEIPTGALESIKEEFEKVLTGDVKVHPRFDEFIGVYHHKAYGKVEITKSSEPGQLSIYRAPFKAIMYPNHSDCLKFYEVSFDGIALADEWRFEFKEQVELYLEYVDEDGQELQVLFQKCLDA